jgi:hypothetical protein
MTKRIMVGFCAVLIVALSVAGSRAEEQDGNSGAIHALRMAIEHDYAYRDLRVKDWDIEFRRYHSELARAASPDQFAEVAARLLSAAQDVHLNIVVGEKKIPTHWATHLHPKCNPAIMPQLVPEWNQHNRIITSGRFPGGPYYLSIGLWVAPRPTDFDAVFDVIDEVSGTDSLIIDVRHNPGGSETFAQAVAGCFADRPVVYAKHRKTDSTCGDGFTPTRNRVLQPNTKHPYRGGPVVVLMGPKCVSTTESFLLMMREAAGCTLIGEKSYGASGAPRPVELPNGVTVLVPSGQAMDKDGNLIEGKGIQPDIAVNCEKEDFDSADPILARALQFLREENGKDSNKAIDSDKK